MVEKKKENKFEFVLYINDYKIISRYFPVEGYSPKTRYSVNIKEMVEDIVFQIQHNLKMQDVNHIYDKYDLRENAFNNKWSAEIKAGKKYVEDVKKLKSDARKN